MCSLQPPFLRVQLRTLPVTERRSWLWSSAARRLGEAGFAEPGFWSFPGPREMRVSLEACTSCMYTVSFTESDPSSYFPGCRSQNAWERRAPMKSRPNGALKLSEGCYPELPHRPFSTAPSLPSSRVRNPTTQLAPGPQDSAAKPKPRRQAPRFVQRFPSTTVASAPASPGPPAAHSGGVLSFLSWVRLRGQPTPRCGNPGQDRGLD